MAPVASRLKGSFLQMSVPVAVTVGSGSVIRVAVAEEVQLLGAVPRMV